MCCRRTTSDFRLPTSDFRHPSAPSVREHTAKRRQVPRLRANPVGVCCAARVRNRSRPRSAYSERTPSVPGCQYLGEVYSSPVGELDHDTTNFGDEIDEHRYGQEECQEEVNVQFVPA